MTSESFEDVLGMLRTDGIGPSDFGPAAPAIARLLGTLTSPAAPGELAGEQAALAMFRSNIAPDALAPADELAWRRRLRRMRQLGVLHPVRIAVAATVVVVGGFIAAAYTAVLPAPVQHIAYQAFHYIGVPDGVPSPHRHQHQAGSGSAPHRSRPAPGASRSRSHPTPSASARPSPGRTASPSPSSHASPKPSAHPNPSASPSLAGPLALTAQAVATRIQGGSAATVDGVLTAGGQPVAGITISLIEHVAGEVGWFVVATAKTTSQGVVAVTDPGLGTTARFRLKASDGAISSAVRVVVIPSVTLSIRLGSQGIKDYLTAATAYADPGDTVLLQVQQSSGAWVTRQAKVLNAAGAKTFVLNAQTMQGKTLRVVLLATTLHGRAVSADLLVPPPA
jgi:hypothetical protein